MNGRIDQQTEFTTQIPADAAFLLEINPDNAGTRAYRRAAFPLLMSRGVLLVFVKNLEVLTAGAPADLGTITVPAWLTRYGVLSEGGQALAGAAGSIVAETAAGTLAGAAVELRDAAGGAGNLIANATTLPAAASTRVNLFAVAGSLLTTPTIHVRQTTNSANAGTVSIYLSLIPLL